MSQSQNGWEVIDRATCRNWLIPHTEARVLPLNPDHAGFVLIWVAHWFHSKIEPLDEGQLDDWGWASRPIGGSTVISNHASGTAEDLNATRHPRDVPTAKTFTPRQIRQIHRMLRRLFGVVRWGGDYVSRPDGMHFEINDDHDRVRIAAYWLSRTRRGRKILRANPGYTRPGRQL